MSRIRKQRNIVKKNTVPLADKELQKKLCPSLCCIKF